jgi:hypothetical protein
MERLRGDGIRLPAKDFLGRRGDVGTFGGLPEKLACAGVAGDRLR